MKSGLVEHYVLCRDLRKICTIGDRAEGVYIWDKEGKRYLDGSGGACVVSIGHSVPEIIDVMTAQARRVSFVHGSQFLNEGAMECAERLVRLAPDPSLNRVYFVSGGSEAVETAIKIVRQYWCSVGKPERYKIIGRWLSFHGNTLGALSIGGHVARRRFYLPLFSHMPHISPCYCYHCPLSLNLDTCNLSCADELERTILYEGPESVAAFIAEPVVGATAGAVVPKEGYWRKIREICDRYDVILIADEVMTGIGRTGRSFALDHWNVIPDIIVVAKGLSSGYTPLGAVIVKDRIWSAIGNGLGIFVHGHTYGQNPLSTAIGAAVLRYIEDHGLVKRAHLLGNYLLTCLENLREFRIVGDTRGIGLFAGIEFVKDKETKESFDPQRKIATRIAQEAFRRGLITYPGSGGVNGSKGDHILLAPPFIIERDQIDEIVDILTEAIRVVESEELV
ncbi:MAG: aspartate aminotransferase family protein [Syntrophobacterales bacterium]|nr:aspartate aminotransferase family protein [Syntrophobacterales bacterium]